MNLLARQSVTVLRTLFLSILVFESRCQPEIIIKSPAGTFRGSVVEAFSGNNLAAFRGIPYAQPPVGNLRFAKPQPLSKIKNVFDATQAAPVCLQPLGVNIGDPGQEDCLYLNVFAPLQEQSKGSTLKVLVYIHGGAFFMGSGNEYIPGDLVSQGNVIVVTLNHRLSWLGFLKGKTPLLPGNQGLWDQLMALRWVKNNIAAFGGDADDITIAGESMGGESVSVWSLLKQGKDLFTKGIVMSGTMISCPSTPGSSDILLDLLLDRVGCWPSESQDTNSRTSQTFTDDTMSEVVACLRDLPSEKFVLPAEGSFTNKFTSIDGDLFPAPLPELIRDYQHLNDVGFFSKTFLFSLVNHEGAPLSTGVFGTEKGADSELDFLVKKMRLPAHLVHDIYKWYEEEKAALFNVADDMWADHILIMPTFELLEAHIQERDENSPEAQRGSSFFIWFDHNPGYMPPSHKGMVHEMELTYLFDIKPNFVLKSFYEMDTEKEFTDEDWKLKSKLIDIVTDFMRHGEPGLTLSKDCGITWPKFEDKNQFYLNFNTDMLVKQFPLHERRHFWKEIFPKWLQDFQKMKEKRDEL